MYVLNGNYYSTFNPVFDDVCFVLLLWPFGLTSKDVWFGFQSGHDYTQFPNFFTQISPFHPLLSSSCLVLCGLQIVIVLLQNKMV